MCRSLTVRSLLFAIVAMLGGCGAKAETTLPAPESVRSTLPRTQNPQATQADVATLTLNNAAFGLELMRTVAPTGNFIVSPHAISTALAMTYAGARTTTHDEMRKVLRFELSDATIDPAFDALDLALASRNSPIGDANKRPVELHVANSLWAQKGYSFLPSYLDGLAQYYGAGLWLLDFAGDPNGAVASINDWASRQTNGRIPSLLDSLDSSTALVLTNATYFLADWDRPFLPTQTKDAAFHLLGGATVNVPFMNGTQRCGYAETAGWQALELDYVGGQMSMVVILPPPGDFGSLVSSLQAGGLESIVSSIVPAGAEVSLPKLTFQTATKLKPTLQAMGMPSAFADADFSGMTGGRDLFLEDVVHRATIRVDEQGTEAAAAAAVVAARVSQLVTSLVFNANRPFLFVVRDKPTGAVLFLGQVTDPS